MKHNNHEGQKLRELILSITTVEKLSAKIGKHRNTISNWFSETEVSATNLILVGKALRYDLSSMFPKLMQHPDSAELRYFNEDPAPYFKTVKEVQALVEKKNQTIADHAYQVTMLQGKINDMKQIIEDKNLIIDSKNQIIDMLQNEIEEIKRGVKSA